MSVRTYNPSVRVGNWNEDIQLEEVSIRTILFEIFICRLHCHLSI